MPQDRRTFVMAAGTIGVAGLAGCIGDTGSDNEWPPAGGTVEGYHTTDSGGVNDMVMRAVAGNIDSYLDGVDDITVNPRPEAQGIPIWNQLQNADPDGSQWILERPNNAFIQEIANPQADYNTGDFRPLFNSRTMIRDIALNPRVDEFDIDGHLQMTWDDIVEYAEEHGLQIPFANAHQRLCANLLREWDPRLNEDNCDIIEVPSGGEARAAIERGELECYLGGPTSSMTDLSDYYLTQVMFIDPDEEPDFWDGLVDWAASDEINPEPVELTEEHTLNASDEFPDERATDFSHVSVDQYMIFTTPGVPDDTYETILDGFREAVDDPDFEEALLEQYSEVGYVPRVGDENMELINASEEVLTENEDVVRILDELFE